MFQESKILTVNLNKLTECSAGVRGHAMDSLTSKTMKHSSSDRAEQTQHFNLHVVMNDKKKAERTSDLEAQSSEVCPQRQTL